MTAAQRLAEHLAATRRVRVERSALLGAWATAAPELVGRAENVERLADALAVLADGGTVELPSVVSKASWDTSTRPPLPKFVLVAANRRPRREPRWRTIPWRAELGWAASLTTLSDPDLATLEAIDRWLGANPPDATPIVPSRVRSAEILGNEKRLNELSKSILFRSDRLTWDLLRARPMPPPLAIRTVGDGPDVLVVENSDSYWVCSDAAQAVGGAIGRVAWGAGRSAERSVAESIASLLTEPRPIGDVFYWGDLDPTGVAIGANVDAAAREAGIGRVPPHRGLWEALCRLEATDMGTHPWPAHPGGWAGGWLWEASRAVRLVSGRVAQERVATATIRAVIADSS